MTVGWITRVNSSYGKGIIVSLENGKRKEEFTNTEENWFLAKEFVLYESWADFELKTPGLGDLLIVMRERHNEKIEIGVAQFPKGTWEYARLSIGGKTKTLKVSRDSCPEGCFVKGYADLSEETQQAHMEYNH